MKRQVKRAKKEQVEADSEESRKFLELAKKVVRVPKEEAEAKKREKKEKD